MKKDVEKDKDDDICYCFFYQVEIKGFKRRMLIVSIKLPRLISTVPLVWTVLMVYGPFVGLLIFGWLDVHRGPG